MELWFLFKEYPFRAHFISFVLELLGNQRGKKRRRVPVLAFPHSEYPTAILLPLLLFKIIRRALSLESS
jgi:hypothetical protein